MALNRTLLQIRDNVRLCADVGGTTATQRHTDAHLNDYINRGIGALYRILSQAIPDQRYLTSATKSTTNGTASYALSGFTPSVTDLDHLISVDINANGVKSWLTAYEMHERPVLSDTNVSWSGVPFHYRLRGANIELLPTPGGAYTLTIWYVPNFTQLSSDGSNYDTINRLDDYIVWYAARHIATRDRNWELADRCTAWLTELEEDIQVIARSLDKNSPSRIVDESLADRWGRNRRFMWR